MSTLATVQRILAHEMDLPSGILDPTQPLTELGVDSLMVIEAMFQLENEFHIEMPREQVPLQSIQDIVDLVDRLVADAHSRKISEPIREGERPCLP